MSQMLSLHDLLGALRDGELSPDQAAALDRMLVGDAAARVEYVLYTLLRADLRERHATTVTRATAPARLPKPHLSEAKLPVRRFPYALAAALLLAACGVVIYAFAIDPRSAIPHAQSLTPIATVIDTTGGGTLVVGDSAVMTGAEVGAGDLSLDTGAAELQLGSGASIQIVGRTSMLIHDAMNVTVSRGSATFTCPPSAKGFTVHTPAGARIVDLGTRFEVERSDDGGTRVRVLEGSVRLIGIAGLDQTLTRDQTARLAADGTLAELRYEIVYVSADASNTHHAADPRAAWSSAPDGRPASRHNFDHLWGTPPLDQGFDATPRPTVWESVSTESPPTLATRIDDLPHATYEVYVLWVTRGGAATDWTLEARRAADAEFTRFVNEGEPVETNRHGHVLMRSALGRVTGTSIAAEVRAPGAPGSARTRYVGLAYRRVDAGLSSPDGSHTPAAPADADAADSKDRQP